MRARPPSGWRLLRRCAGALLLAALLLLAGLLLWAMPMRRRVG